MKDLERNLKALANARRLAIVRMLMRKKQASVGQVADHIKLSFKSTSRHLSVLTSAGVLDKEQVGLEVFHRLAERRHQIVSDIMKLL